MIELIKRDERFKLEIGDSFFVIRRLALEGGIRVANMQEMGVDGSEAILDYSLESWGGVCFEDGQDDEKCTFENKLLLPAIVITLIVNIARSTKASIWRDRLKFNDLAEMENATPGNGGSGSTKKPGKKKKADRKRDHHS